MRTSNSIKNILFSLILGFVVIIINFIAQRFFVESLGIEYLGLNGLLTNVVSLLSIVELGLGAAIVYHLYEPMHRGDIQKVSSIMQFYRLGYRVIALAIVILGVVSMPFLPLIVGESSIAANIPLIYTLFIGNAAVSYLLSYKRSILYADQKNYIINAIHLAALLVLNGLQIWALILTQNYYLYLALRVAATLIENFIINTIVNKRYSIDILPEPLNKALRKDIFTKVKGLAFHKMGSFLVLGSTNIIISVILGISTVGLYSNYLLIQTAFTTLSFQVSSAIKASIGNLLVDANKEAAFSVFKRLQFANQLMAVVVTSIFFISSSSFVKLWLGDDFVFGIGVVAAMSLNLYLILVRSVFNNFKEAAGIFYEDRLVPLIESAINIIASIILMHFMGLAGAFIGTALSSLALHAYSYPKYVYKGIFGKSYREYTQKVLSDLFVAIVIIVTAWGVSRLVNLDSLPLQLFSDVVIAVIVPAVLLWVLYRQRDEYLYFKGLVVRMAKKLKRR